MTRVFWKVLKEGRVSLTLAAVVEILSGALLQSRLEALISLPILLAIVPPLNDMAGDLGTIIVARLTTAFYLGSIEPRLRENKGLRMNLSSLMVVCVLTVLYISMLSTLSSTLHLGVFDAGILFRIISIIMLAGMTGVFFTLVCGTLLSVASFKKGYDPDTMVMPVITVIGDFLSIGSVLLISRMFGLV